MSRSLNFAVWFVGLASYSNFAPKIVLDYKKKKKRKLVDVDAVTRQHVSFPLGGLWTIRSERLNLPNLNGIYLSIKTSE